MQCKRHLPRSRTGPTGSQRKASHKAQWVPLISRPRVVKRDEIWEAGGAVDENPFRQVHSKPLVALLFSTWALQHKVSGSH